MQREKEELKLSLQYSIIGKVHIVNSNVALPEFLTINKVFVSLIENWNSIEKKLTCLAGC